MRNHRASWSFHEAVLEELADERAGTLGRAGVRLNEALAEYRSALEDGGPERVAAALAQARHAAWALAVQRECAGFRAPTFDWMKEHWQVPDEVLRGI
ncbi:MAG: DUF6665 family protein [Sporichthyaceae bacterium]